MLSHPDPDHDPLREQERSQAASRSTWVSVDRPVYVALTLPNDSGPSPIQTVSDLITRTLPAVPIRPGPPR